MDIATFGQWPGQSVAWWSGLRPFPGSVALASAGSGGQQRGEGIGLAGADRRDHLVDGRLHTPRLARAHMPDVVTPVSYVCSHGPDEDRI